MLQKLLAGLLSPLVKPIVKEVMDKVVEPALTKLIAQIPNADGGAIIAQINSDIDAFIDKELS